MQAEEFPDLPAEPVLFVVSQRVAEVDGNDLGPIPLLHERAAFPFCSSIVTVDAILNSLT
jgi:hypothetical protein